MLYHNLTDQSPYTMLKSDWNKSHGGKHGKYGLNKTRKTAY